MGDVVLVCDIGGTTDFLLIAITSGGSLDERLAVGEHMLLGGDNMDFALAFALPRAGLGIRLDRWQLTSLVQGACSEGRWPRPYAHATSLSSSG